MKRVSYAAVLIKFLSTCILQLKRFSRWLHTGMRTFFLQSWWQKLKKTTLIGYLCVPSCAMVFIFWINVESSISMIPDPLSRKAECSTSSQGTRNSLFLFLLFSSSVIDMDRSGIICWRNPLNRLLNRRGLMQICPEMIPLPLTWRRWHFASYIITCKTRYVIYSTHGWYRVVYLPVVDNLQCNMYVW